MPSPDFWFLAGLGLVFLGWGIMKVLIAMAGNIEARSQRGAKN